MSFELDPKKGMVWARLEPKQIDWILTGLHLLEDALTEGTLSQEYDQIMTDGDSGEDPADEDLETLREYLNCGGDGREPDDAWEEDPNHPRIVWNEEAGANDTSLGYWVWRQNQKDMDEGTDDTN